MTSRMIRMFFLLLIMSLSFQLNAAETVDGGSTKSYLSSIKNVYIHGQKLVDAGEFDQSNRFLFEALKLFPDSDMILSLYGKSLYESGSTDEAEGYFMKALRLNADNILAQQYISQIRDVRTLSVSESSQEWAVIINDKIGDLIVFVLSIWLGTSLNSIWRFFMLKWNWQKAKRSYLRKDYNDVVRILESHVVEVEHDAIDLCLRFMLSNGDSVEDVAKILKRFVVREEDLKVLLRSLELLEYSND